MAEASSRALFTGEQVLHLLDNDSDDDGDCVDDVFFPGSDDELGFVEEEVDERYVKSVTEE